MAYVYGGLSTIPVLSDVYASTFAELGIQGTNQRSAMPDADWLSALDERGGTSAFAFYLPCFLLVLIEAFE